MVVYKQKQPIQLNTEQIDLIRKLCAKDANDEEFKLYMQIARTSRLDPFKKEIYCLIFHGERGGRQQVILTGIGGYRAVAARDHADYDGTSKPTFTFANPPRKTPIAGRDIPETCSMEAYAKGSTHATGATIYWDEYAPKDMTSDRADFWRRMPCNQLAKCCEGHLLRKRFSGLNNIYVDAELDQRLADYTPEGRQMHTRGVAPSGHVVDSYKVAKAEQNKLLKEKFAAHGHPAGSAAAKQAEAQLQKVEEADERFANAKNITGTSEDKPATKSKRAGTSKSGAKRIPAGATLLTGTIHTIVHTTTAVQKKPVIKLQLNREWFNIYSTTIQAFFPAGREEGMIGNVVQCYTKKYPSEALAAIVGLKRVGDLHFEEDGRTLIPREPGAEG